MIVETIITEETGKWQKLTLTRFELNVLVKNLPSLQEDPKLNGVAIGGVNIEIEIDDKEIEKCWHCGQPIRNVRIAAQHGSWSGIFCTNTCVQAYEQAHKH